MWSPDSCIEMLLIFSLKEVDERFKSGAVLPWKKVMIKCSLPQWRSRVKRELWKADGLSWPGLATVCPLSTPSNCRKELSSLPADPENPCTGDGQEILTNY